MYASLVGAGISKLSDLLQSATSSSTSSDPSFSVPSSSSSSASPSANAPLGSSSTDLNQLFLDLQASQSASATSASTTSANTTSAASSGGTGSVDSVANDLKSVFGDLNSAGAGHAHHYQPDHDSGSQTAAASDTSANPFQNLAASLTAYSNSQALTTSQGSTTSLTA